MDYTKTYVRIQTQEEQNKAIDFYKSKWYPLGNLDGRILPYIRISMVSNSCANFTEVGDRTIDITEEVLWVGLPTDYKDTYILTENNLERTNLAIEFYKSKWNFNNETRYKYNIYVAIDSCLDIVAWGHLNNCEWRRNITEEFNQRIRLTNKSPTSIPENTAVRITSEREFNLLMDAYEKRGWKRESWSNPTKWRPSYDLEICIGFEKQFGYASVEYYKEQWYEIISTEEAMKILGEDISPKCQSEKQINNQFVSQTKKEPIIKIDTFVGWIIDESDAVVNSDLFNELRDKTLTQLLTQTQTFNLKQPTKMTSLIDSKLFDRFLKSTETKVLDAVELAETNANDYEELINRIDSFYNLYTRTTENLKRAYNNQNKTEIKTYLKELNSMEDTIKDPLFEQFFMVVKSINKVLDKSNTKKN